jgi:AcrR family transcriptional regulator
MQKKTKRRVSQRRGTGQSEPQAVDERILRSKETVLRVTSELLTETGLGGISVDEVSRRSGVAKTTIYRHWPTRSDLLIEACSKMGTAPEVPDTGSFRGDVEILMAGLAERLRSARWPSVLPSVIDAAERDSKIAELHGRLHANRIAPLHEVIERAKRKGEVPSSLDPATVIASLLGPLFYRRWFSREPLDEKFLKKIIGNALGS